MQRLSCEFCNSRIGPILAQDMGDGRVMHLCPRCRRWISEGIEKESREGQYPVVILIDGKAFGTSTHIDSEGIARAILPHLANIIRNATGHRNF